MARRGSKILLLLILLAGAVVVGAHWPAVEARFASAGGAGAPVFAAAFVALTMGCFPVSVLGITAGVMYGVAGGLAVVMPSVAAGGLLMFALGRSILREPIRRRVATRPRWQALEELAAAKAVRLNVLARLSPFNYGLVCYTLAAGRSSLRAYALGLLGTVPSLTAHVLVGTLLRSGGEALHGGRASAVRVGATTAAVLALLVLTWQVGRLALSAWREAAAAVERNGAREDSRDP